MFVLNHSFLSANHKKEIIKTMKELTGLIELQKPLCFMAKQHGILPNCHVVGILQYQGSGFEFPNLNSHNSFSPYPLPKRKKQNRNTTKQIIKKELDRFQSFVLLVNFYDGTKHTLERHLYRGRTVPSKQTA